MLLSRLPNPNSLPRLVLVRFHRSDRRSIRNPQNHPTDPSLSYDPWIVKIISTLYVLSRSLTTHLGFLGIELNPSIAYHCIRRLNNPRLALGFFEVLRSEFELNHSADTYNFLVNTLCRAGLEESAKDVFDLMRRDGYLPDDSLLGFLVSSCAKAGNFDSAMGLLIQAHECGCRLKTAVYNNLLNLMVKNNRVNDAICFFRASSFHSDTFTFNIIIKGLCRCGEIERAFQFFYEMGTLDCIPDIITYNTLVDGLCRCGRVDKARDMLNEMQLRGFCLPDVRTYTQVMSGYCKMGKMENASCVFKEMVAAGIRPSLVTYNALLDGYGKAGQMDAAMSMYENMLDDGCSPDVVTFTSLIDGYCRSGRVDDAMKLWDGMGEKRISPNGYSFAIIINSLCKENRLHEAHDLLMQLMQSNVIPQAFMYNPVVDCFCKAGNVDEASRIVAEMERKGSIHDKFTFTILIIGHCMKGRMHEAIYLFNKMLAIGCAPDMITVNSLISCLLKAGMPHEANRIAFTVSTKDFDLNLGSSREIPSFKKNKDVPVAA